MRTYHLIFVLLIFGFIAKANDNENWNEGYLILKNQEIVKGKVFYNVEHDMVQVKVDQQIKTFSPFNVLFFKYYDEKLEMNRVFAAFERNQKKARKNVKSFFEVLIKGDLVLLRKEENTFTPTHQITFHAIDFVSDINFSHFIYSPEGIKKINNFNKDVLPLMSDRKDEINEYIKNFDLSTANFVHQILIIDYYNYVKDPTYIVLKDQFVVKN